MTQHAALAALGRGRCLVIGDGVCDAFLLVFFERQRPSAHQSAAWIARQMRKIEGGGSLTILGTARIETGSKMDEVVF